MKSGQNLYDCAAVYSLCCTQGSCPTYIYLMQAECLNLPGVRTEGRNLVYSAPTGGNYPCSVCVTLNKLYPSNSYIVKTSICNPSLLCAGAGKSAVAEVLTLGRWDATERCALYVLPYVALCEQKAQSLVKLLRPLGRYQIMDLLILGSCSVWHKL